MRQALRHFSIAGLTAVLVAASILAATHAFTRNDLLTLDNQPNMSAQARASQKAPDFRFSDIQGRSVSRASLQGKVIIIDFWATWCPPCRIAIPVLNDIQEKYRHKGLEVVAISLDDSVDTIKAYINSTRLNYTVVHGNQSIAEQFGGIDALPTTVFLDRQGNIRGKHLGLMDRTSLERAVQELLSE